jgi:hypothetical protein
MLLTVVVAASKVGLSHLWTRHHMAEESAARVSSMLRAVKDVFGVISGRARPPERRA